MWTNFPCVRVAIYSYIAIASYIAIYSYIAIASYGYLMVQCNLAVTEATHKLVRSASNICWS